MEILMLFGLLMMAPNIFPFLQRMLQYASNYTIPNAEPEPATAIALKVRHLIDDVTYKGVMRDQGYNAYWAGLQERANVSLLAAMDYVSLYRRGKIDRGTLDNYAGRLGYIPAELDNILAVSEYFPNPADLVRFAVREVYSPNVVEAFKMDEDLPAQYLAEAAKAGVPRDQAINFWRAHWGLPGANQGFEMYQRGIIKYDTLVLLLKTLDVMPYWRDKLIQLAFSPLTRVDVRRMYAEGVLRADQLPQKYQDNGYSPENAQLLADFTVKYENRETKGLTRAQVIKSYVDDLITREELSGYLVLFGYADEVVQFWLDQADFQKLSEELTLFSDDLVAQYMAGGKDITQVKIDLDSLDLPVAYVQKVLRKIVLQKSKKLKVPAREDLERWLQLGYIDEAIYTAQMRLLGYEDWSIELYLTQYAEAQDTSVRKYLPLGTYLRWAKAGIITVQRFREIMVALKYSAEDIDNTVGEAGLLNG